MAPNFRRKSALEMQQRMLRDGLTQGRVMLGYHIVFDRTRMIKDERVWLEIEGFLGLVWDGGQWLSRRVRSEFSGKFKRKRRIISGEKGTAYMTSLSRRRYPDLFAVNGTDYSDHCRGDLVYRIDGGEVLNVTSVGDRTI